MLDNNSKLEIIINKKKLLDKGPAYSEGDFRFYKFNIFDTGFIIRHWIGDSEFTPMRWFIGTSGININNSSFEKDSNLIETEDSLILCIYEDI